MKAKTIKGQSVDQLKAELEQTTSDGFRPTLALVFLSIRQNREEICRLLDAMGIRIFGATTAGEFIDGDVAEGSVVIMLLDLDDRYFRIVFENIGENDLKSLARQIGLAGKQTFANPAFLVSYSGLYTDGEQIVRGIEDTAGEATAIFGGMAGDDMTWSGPCVFTNDSASDKAIVAAIIDADKISLRGHATSGWKPVGTERTITRSEGSVVYTIDDEPALDVVMKFLGVSAETNTAANEVLTKMGSYFPILMQRPNGDPVVRTTMFANFEERCLKFSGNVPQGSRFRFALPPDFDVVDEVIEQSKEIKSQQLPQADALVMFSCVARHLTLGPMVSDEIEGLKKVWGSPLIGFFSYGEIGKTAYGKHEFHNNTCCLVALKEIDEKPATA
ncbi:FIST signal transduction protein [Flavisolibacter nicotianae]|uniref:FIST signal transduction protein n=1 Tax=Flavisolibacter nicotianae TaxID=2364882 RepID=UPI000EB3DAB9|nr:FIST N-terminal domain-containing protein [Flavisolibacter nicotianae]